MRVEGEIDIGLKRPIEDPKHFKSTLRKTINVQTPRESYAELRKEALKQQDIVFKSLSKRKEKKLRKWVRIMENFMPYREHPKYVIINAFQIYRNFLKMHSSFYTIEEIIQNKKNPDTIKEREQIYIRNQRKNPIKAILSTGEIYKVKGSNVLNKMGMGVSGGKITGKVRIVYDQHDINFENGEILVTRFTDPSWTILMAKAGGMIIEVGGMMTHGAVVAREYGIPTIVGYENATNIFQTGETITLDGDLGTVEIKKQ